MIPASFNKFLTVSDGIAPLFNHFIATSSLIFTSAYFIYALVTKTGNFIANIILASLFVGYTIFYFITRSMEMKTAKKIVKRSYKWIKIVIKTFTLGAMIYGIYITTTNVTPISIILATLMIILYVLQILLELACEIVEDKKANGIYNVDEFTLQELDKKLVEFEEMASTLENLVEITDQQIKLIREESKKNNDEIAQMPKEEFMMHLKREEEKLL